MIKREGFIGHESIEAQLKIKWLGTHKKLTYAILGVGLLGGFIVLMAGIIKNEKMSSVLIGIGTGLIASAIATFFTIRAQMIVEDERKGLLRMLIMDRMMKPAMVVYEDLIYHINKCILDCQLKTSGVYYVYKEKDSFEAFMKVFEQQRRHQESNDRLDEIYKFYGDQVLILAAELSSISASLYLLNDIFSDSDMGKIDTKAGWDTFYDLAKSIDAVWDGHRIIDLDKALYFLNITMVICTRVINLTDPSGVKVRVYENNAKDSVEMLENAAWESSPEFLEQIAGFSEYYSENIEYYEEQHWKHELMEAILSKNNDLAKLQKCLSIIPGCNKNEFKRLLKSLDKDDNNVKLFFGYNCKENNFLTTHKFRKYVLKQYGDNFLDGCVNHYDAVSMKGMEMLVTEVRECTT